MLGPVPDTMLMELIGGISNDWMSSTNQDESAIAVCFIFDLMPEGRRDEGSTVAMVHFLKRRPALS